METVVRTQHSPFLVAHRAGNDLDLLRQAEHAGVRLVEADVHLVRGRLEVRHLKTLGPVPILWDRWRLAAPWAPRLHLDRLLGAAAPGTELMLDLKGRNPRLPMLVAAALDEHGGGRGVTVCSQSWSLLAPFAGRADVRRIWSVGNRRQLARLDRLPAHQRLDGVSIHRRLLDAATVERLKARADSVITWPISEADDARALAAWGVDGVTTECFVDLGPALRPDHAVAA